MQLAVARMRNRLLQRRLGRGNINSLAERNLHALDGLKGSSKALACRYVVVDLETTGLSLARDQVLSLGAVRLDQGEAGDEDFFYELVNPGCRISSESQQIHGISPEMVSDARCFDEVFSDFLTYLGGDIIVAHHARFDLHFLNVAMRRAHGFNLQNLVLDTELMCRHHKVRPPIMPFAPMTNPGGMNLGKLARTMGVRVGDRHTSIGDAVMTAGIFLKCLERNFGGARCTLGRLVWSAGII